MEVTGTKRTNLTSEKISPKVAQQYLDNYLQDCTRKGEDPAKILKSLRFDKAVIKAILANEKCAYIRLYFGMPPASSGDLAGDYTLMLVGVDANNENILDEGDIYDNATPCPTNCPKIDFE